MARFFLDTNVLLSNLDWVEAQEKVYISATSLRELESIKSSRSKTDEVRYQARKAVRWLTENPDRYEVPLHSEANIQVILANHGLADTPDARIIIDAYLMESDDLVFVSNDLLCGLFAKNIFQMDVMSVENRESDSYKGYREVSLSDEDMAYFYEHLNENTQGLEVNEYLVLKNDKGEVVDLCVWREGSYQKVKIPTIKSTLYGNVKPYNGDIYQQMVLDSLSQNQLTMIKGPAGTGKSYLAVGYLLWLLEKGRIDKIIVFCNTVATANSARLGYYPGTKDEKLLDSQIGNMLSSKLGDSFAVEQMIQRERLILLPMSDIRGYDTTNMNAGIYITEAQNMDISLMKLALQRIGEDSVCIIDGDYNAQVDLSQYAGSNNGMRRMSEIFRGQDFYGEVELKNIYRSKIARIAESM